ncbi:hypothetical protein B0H16DRAFT_1715678 [Mycena metata]|uniref:RING-type domain-containing protein n=1 Tax=Mycena metata TaxID=1033252 RepID=A0AAD7JTB6_9AGAR|nr:hypothetical protein B0H16DRAFT_1715678 [Mycena metata]
MSTDPRRTPFRVKQGRGGGQSNLFAKHSPLAREEVRARLADSGRRARHSPPPRTRLKVQLKPAIDRTRPGHREQRLTALIREDLYFEGRLPVHQSTSRRSQRCSLCLSAKSHPVSYLCGHSHCYACIRLHLERSWECPTAGCSTVMQRAPHRHYPDEEALAEDFPLWVTQTAVFYTWDGLTFPKLPSTYTISSDDETA